MKARMGFVSNSSSSSFIVAYTDKKKLKKELEKIFALPKGHVLGMMADDLVESFLNNMESTYTTVKEFNESGETENFDHADLAFIRINLAEGKTVSIGSFTDDSGEASDSLLCNSELNYKSKDVNIKHEGGY